MQRRKFLTHATAASSIVVTALSSSTHPLNAKPQRPEGVKKPFVVKAGDARFGIHTPYRGINVNDLKISGKDTNDQLAVFEYIGKQKVGPPLHVHTDQDEIFSIIEGEYLFQVGENQFTVKAGDTVFGPRTVPHTWLQLSDVGKMTYLVQPAGKLEDFFLKMNELKGPPAEDLVQKMHEEHGMTVLGPPLALK